MILGIESTMDETGAALVESWGKGVRVISNVKASSARLFKKYGGVVPEVAAREQVKVMIPVIEEALIKGLGNKWRKGLGKLEAVAVAYGPGMMGSLLVGVETAKMMADVWDKNLIKVNHMVGHVMANWIIKKKADQVPELPAIGLIVSGGHTDIVRIKSLNKWQWLGGTRDDAVGEAFDKVARLLKLASYPGGPAIEKEAQECLDKFDKRTEDRLPRPMINTNNLDMSFSGIKTAVLHRVEKRKSMDKKWVGLMAKEFNQAVVEVLVKKTMKAVEKYETKSVLLAGGVAANKLLRKNLGKEVESKGIKMFMPALEYCTDDAAMIGAAAAMNFKSIEPNRLKARSDLGVVEGV